MAAPNALGYRSKIVLHAALTKKGVSLGYFTEDNRSILDVPRCPLAVEPVSELLKLPRTIGAGAWRPMRWLETRPGLWLWLHRLSVTLGLLLAILAVAVLILNLLGLFL